MSKETLQEQFEDYAKSLLPKKQPSLEEIFQATLDVTTPAEPGDLRTTRKWKDAGADEPEPEWV